MRRSLLHISLRSLFLAALAAGGALSWGAPHPEADSDVLLATMQAELERAKYSLAKSDPAPYFISYEVYAQHSLQLAGNYGTIVPSLASNRGWADVTMRVGRPVLDNTHNENRSSGITSGPLPLADDRDAISRTLWDMTNREYRRASPAYAKVVSNSAVQAEEEDKSPDFSQEASRTQIDHPGAAIAFNQKEWEDKIRKYSSVLRKYPEVYSSSVTLQIQQSTSYFVSGEGSKVESPGVTARLVVEANTRADDGMDLVRVETFDSTRPDGLPSDQALAAMEEKMAAHLN